MIGWINGRELNGEYFKLYKSRGSELTLDYYLDKINVDDYYVYKGSSTFRMIDNVDGKYSSYIFFEKDLYDCKDIDKWIEEIRKIDKSKFCYLDKPFPRIEVINKIEMI